jgi:tRNA (guanine-N7-)-methyltransferase
MSDIIDVFEGEEPGGFRRSHVHGRRRARGLTDRQESALAALLPQVRLDLDAPAPVDLAELFPGGADAVWLEIGFGGGEHLAWHAAANPGTGMIGCEPFVNGVAKLLCEIADRGLTNVRLYDHDARHLLGWLPDGGVSRVFMLYPDPWPKRRHWKRRLLNGESLAVLARVMSRGGEFLFATDSAPYARATLALMRRQSDFSWEAGGPGDWREPPADWLSTRYEQKAIRAGRKPCYLRFRRR